MGRATYCAAIMLAAALPICAWAQTYDTPDNLAVSLSHPVYMYVDPYGYAHVTGMVHNESTISSVGNVLIYVQYYDATGPDPIHTETIRASLDVLPPGSYSPFAATHMSNRTISSATATLLGFAPANPKHMGLEMAPNPRSPDIVVVSDTSGINHTGVTIHAAYHDAFDPPRILRAYATYVGDVGAGQSIPYVMPEPPPQSARGFMVFAESDSFSSVMYQGVLDDVGGDTAWYGARIVDAGVSGGYGGVAPDPAHIDTINVSIVSDDPGAERWLYVVVKRLDTMVAVWLERVPVDAAGTTSIPWEPPSPGRYVIETYLWDNANVPVAEPGSPVTFLVG